MSCSLAVLIPFDVLGCARELGGNPVIQWCLHRFKMSWIDQLHEEVLLRCKSWIMTTLNKQEEFQNYPSLVQHVQQLCSLAAHCSLRMPNSTATCDQMFRLPVDPYDIEPRLTHCWYDGQKYHRALKLTTISRNASEHIHKTSWFLLRPQRAKNAV